MATREAFDVVIVGARCAGAATAMLLARAGARVLVLDREPLERDPLSTHALMRTAVAQLERWHLLDHVIAAGTPPIRAATFHYGDDQLRVEIGPRNGVDSLYAPRRTVLDPILVEAAWQAGATIAYGARVRDVVRDASGRVTGVVVHDDATRTSRVIHAGLVIGADGLGSTVARRVAAAIREVGAHSSATIYGHWPGLVDDGYHWHYRPGVSVGVIPSNADVTCVFVATPSARYRDELRHDVAAGYRRVLREGAPDIAEAIASQAPVALRPFAGRPSVVRQPWGPGWALVGDAGLFRDPITAHGISDALRDAELLASAVLAGTPAAYTAYTDTRDQLARELLDVTDRIASFAWDTDEIQLLHRRLSRAINRECDQLTRADDVRAAS